MNFGRRALTALGKVGIVLAVLVAFLFGMLGTVYLSLRTAEVTVPDVLGKDRFTAETMLDDVGLKIRVRGARASADKPDTVLTQLPEAGQVVKAGIPVAVEVSRAPKEGESVRSSTQESSQEQEKQEKPAENSNTNQSSTAANQNQNQNQNKPKNKNTNKNTNNSNNANNRNANNSNNANRNANANNRNANANNRNANTNRNTNNRNANTTPNTNRATTNSNNIRRQPPITTPPFNPGANRGTP